MLTVAIAYLYVVSCTPSSHCAARERYAAKDLTICFAMLEKAKSVSPTHTTENEDTVFLLCAGEGNEKQWCASGDCWHQRKREVK